MDFDHDLPKPGDILLLRGKSLFTKPNMTIQSISRLRISRYSHVAMVTGQNMIIDANPGTGITMRQWDEVSHSYDVANSLLVRHKTADTLAIQNLLSRANYYYGQRYKISALIGSKSEFSDNKGIVCSQFIAKIFQDCQLRCSEKPCRKSLPIDIHTFTRANPEWTQRPLSEVKIGLACLSNEITRPMAQATHQADIYVGVSLKQALDFSLLFHKLTAHVADMTDLIDLANGDLIPITMRMAAAPTTNISIGHLIASWRQYFLDPEAKATFLHQDGPAPDKQVKIFVKACEIVKQHNTAADEASNQLYLSLMKIEQLVKSLPPTPTEVEIHTWLASHLELLADMQKQINILDWILVSNPNNFNLAKNFDFHAFMEEYGRCAKRNFSEAVDTLSTIANYCRLCDFWMRQRSYYDQIMSAHNFTD